MRDSAITNKQYRYNYSILTDAHVSCPCAMWHEPGRFDGMRGAPRLASRPRPRCSRLWTPHEIADHSRTIQKGKYALPSPLELGTATAMPHASKRHLANHTGSSTQREHDRALHACQGGRAHATLTPVCTAGPQNGPICTRIPNLLEHFQALPGKMPELRMEGAPDGGSSRRSWRQMCQPQRAAATSAATSAPCSRAMASSTPPRSPWTSTPRRASSRRHSASPAATACTRAGQLSRPAAPATVAGADASSSTSAQSAWPQAQARSRGKRPSSVGTSARAPAASSACTLPTLAAAAAQCRGSHPERGSVECSWERPTSVARRRSRVLASPPSAAQCTAGMAVPPRAPASSSTAIAAACPPSAAHSSGLSPVSLGADASDGSRRTRRASSAVAPDHAARWAALRPPTSRTVGEAPASSSAIAAASDASPRHAARARGVAPPSCGAATSSGGLEASSARRLSVWPASAATWIAVQPKRSVPDTFAPDAAIAMPRAVVSPRHAARRQEASARCAGANGTTVVAAGDAGGTDGAAASASRAAKPVSAPSDLGFGGRMLIEAPSSEMLAACLGGRMAMVRPASSARDEAPRAAPPPTSSRRMRNSKSSSRSSGPKPLPPPPPSPKALADTACSGSNSGV
mmetsp:Transcript_13856/g.35703  ORF Transcript_13856/g.35703 Transcript_13856/m.35703 type:complete len:634 (-) Transcript_13856:1125-3026(-)